MNKSKAIAPKRGRGRPRKDATQISSQSSAPKKSRGRPPKDAASVTAQSAKPAKRRGRPSKENQALVLKSESPVYKTGTPGSYEGLQMLVANMPTPTIETWEFQYPGSKTDLTVDIPEFTCVCPKTGLPDFATIVIDYRPNKLCIELKSLKEYVLFYRNLGIFHEHVVNRMLQDIAKACKPKEMTITGIFNSRGGIQTTVQATL